MVVYSFGCVCSLWVLWASGGLGALLGGQAGGACRAKEEKRGSLKEGGGTGTSNGNCKLLRPPIIITNYPCIGGPQ